MSAPIITNKILVPERYVTDEFTFLSGSFIAPENTDIFLHRDYLSKIEVLDLVDCLTDEVTIDGDVHYIPEGYDVDSGLYSTGYSPDIPYGCEASSLVEYVDVNTGELYITADSSKLVLPVFTNGDCQITYAKNQSTEPTMVARFKRELYGSGIIPTRISQRFTFSHWYMANDPDKRDVSTLRITGDNVTLYPEWIMTNPPTLANGTLLQKVYSDGTVKAFILNSGTWYEVPSELSVFTGLSASYGDTATRIFRFPKSFKYSSTTYNRADGWVIASGYSSSGSGCSTAIYNVVTNTRKTNIAHSDENSPYARVISGMPDCFAIDAGTGINSIGKGTFCFETSTGTRYEYPLNSTDNVFLTTEEGGGAAIHFKDYFGMASTYGISGAFASNDEYCAIFSNSGSTGILSYNWDATDPVFP